MQTVSNHGAHHQSSTNSIPWPTPMVPPTSQKLALTYVTLLYFSFNSITVSQGNLFSHDLDFCRLNRDSVVYMARDATLGKQFGWCFANVLLYDCCFFLGHRSIRAFVLEETKCRWVLITLGMLVAEEARKILFLFLFLQKKEETWCKGYYLQIIG